MKPTKVYQTAQLDKTLLVKNASAPLSIGENTVVIDVRSAFDFAASHIPGSVNLAWQEFAQPNGKYPGRITTDLAQAARRLSLVGIAPGKKVMVVGKGLQGKGEEGRMAWTLFVFGISDVQVASIDQFRLGLTNAEPAQRPNAERWTIDLAKNFVADRKDVLKTKSNGTFIIDVRTRAEYFKVKSDLASIHIPWVEFYNSKGRPDLEIKKRLESIGIGSKDRIIVISNQGLRSGAVAFALLSLGFQNVANATGGYKELRNEK